MKRREGLSKLLGREPYVDDLLISSDVELPFNDAWWGMAVRSRVARGRIRAIRVPDDFEANGGVVVDHNDLPAENVVHLIADDQPILAADVVRHVHEPVLLMAHPSRDVLRRAVAAVEMEIDGETPYLDFEREPTDAERQVGVTVDESNVLHHIFMDKGDVEAALANAPIVVEGVYQTGAQEHVYLETQGMLAWQDDGVVVARGSMQCPYYVQAAMKRGLGRDDDGVRVVQAATGGGFGGKEEYPSVLALHASLLAMKAGRPVRMVYSRGEDMAVTTKRHPSWVRHRTGLTEDGKLLAQDIEVILDAGAYLTLSGVVLSRGVIHAAGPYLCENVRVDGRARLTNRAPYGAFRGFGAPQTHFANERHMDRIADRLGLDPAELRRRNLLRDGERTATGQLINDNVPREALLDRALTMSHWKERRSAHVQNNENHPYLKRGIGLAYFHHGAGFTGSGEVYLNSLVEVAGLRDGRVEVLASSTEMGQGTNTIFTRIAAETLGLEEDDVLVANPDTGRVPDSGPTVASRTVMIVGRLVERACEDLRNRLGLDADTLDESADGAAFKNALKAWFETNEGELKGAARYEPPPGIVWDDKNYRGDAYPTFGWAAYVADVEVDLRTFTATVKDFVAVQDVGNVVHEVLARGQVQGGVVQAIGWALMEDVQDRGGDGSMRNNSMTNYVIPTSDDVPPIRVEFQETPYPFGALGAKGLGELPMDGPAPAIANAVAHALGVDATSVPLTPEVLMKELENAHE